MTHPESTCWTEIRRAAEGDAPARSAFARRYSPVIRAYLEARWRRSPLLREVDDAAQEVFLACLRQSGALTRAEPGRPGGFRAFLFGVVRNIARRFEERRNRRRELDAGDRFDLDEVPADGDRLSLVFDRAWATLVMQDAAKLQDERARSLGAAALRRVELLRLRFQEDKPIREIAVLWDTDTARLHEEYRKARREFQEALTEVVRDTQGGSAREVREACFRLFEAFH